MPSFVAVDKICELSVLKYARASDGGLPLGRTTLPFMIFCFAPEEAIYGPVDISKGEPLFKNVLSPETIARKYFLEGESFFTDML